MLIVGDKAGQLGNRLFLFAHCIATAVEHGFVVVNPGFDEYAESFPRAAGDAWCRWPPRQTRVSSPRFRRAAFLLVRAIAAAIWISGWRRTRWWTMIRLRWREIADLSSREIASNAQWTIVFIQGWLFRNNAALVRQASVLREFFQPADHISDAARRVLEEARRSSDVVVGVHIRQGDYKVHLDGRFYFDLACYREMMQRAYELFPGQRTSFLIASDVDQDVSLFTGVDVHLAPGTAVADLHALAGCDYVLGPPSSFTLWASFFGETPLYPVVDPKRPFDLQSFAVVPTILDREVRELYGFHV